MQVKNIKFTLNVDDSLSKIVDHLNKYYEDTVTPIGTGIDGKEGYLQLLVKDELEFQALLHTAFAKQIETLNVVVEGKVTTLTWIHKETPVVLQSIDNYELGKSLVP